jgi:hypothetical protein
MPISKGGVPYNRHRKRAPHLGSVAGRNSRLRNRRSHLQLKDQHFNCERAESCIVSRDSSEGLGCAGTH